MLLSTYFVLALCSTVLAQPATDIPDSSGCDECKTRYIQWLTGKNINATYWQQHDDAKSAADELCNEADDIYNNCFMVCIIDSNGNTLPHTEDRNAQALQIFLRESCHDHACRLADTLACSRGAGRNKCLPDSRECYVSQLASSECTLVLPCEPAERRAFISTVVDSADCFLQYPALVADGLAEEDERRLGLQVCKDVILSGCLSDWSVDPGKQDFINFVDFESEFQNQVCGSDEALSTMNCIQSALNGTVSYGGSDYEKPCDTSLMTESAVEILQNLVTNIVETYDFVCLANGSGCDDQKNNLLKNDSMLNGTKDGDASLDSPPPSDDTDMAEGDEEKPMDSTDSDDTDHSDHDHHDHDHDMENTKSDTKTPEADEKPTKESDKHHDHKHPGPVGKSLDENSAVTSRSSIAGLVSLLLFTLFLQ